MANLFIRTYTFVDGTTAYGSQVEAEIGNIVTVLNNLNIGSTTWGIVSVSNGVNVPLIADCAAGSQDIADFKNNNVIKASISSSGLITCIGLAAGSQKITGLAAASANGDAVRFEQLNLNAAGYLIGTIVASVQGVDTSNTTSSGTTYTSTTTTASITPKATTHKIRISVTGVLSSTAFSSSNSYGSIFRGAADLSNGNGFVAMSGDTNTVVQIPAAMIYLDSPATTSATTYTVKIKSDTSAKAKWNGIAGSAVILLEEIAY